MKTVTCREMVSMMMFAFFVFALVCANADHAKMEEKISQEQHQTPPN